MALKQDIFEENKRDNSRNSVEQLVLKFGLYPLSCNEQRDQLGLRKHLTGLLLIAFSTSTKAEVHE